MDEIVELKFGGLHPVPFERLDRPNQEFLLVELNSRISVGRVPTSFNAALLCLLTQTWKAPAIQRLEFFSEVSGPSVLSSDCSDIRFDLDPYFPHLSRTSGLPLGGAGHNSSVIRPGRALESEPSPSPFFR